MKSLLLAFLFPVHVCLAQDWQVEGMAGLAGYTGDLSRSDFSFRHSLPSLSVNIKYSLDDRFLLRGGIAYGRVGASDKDNPDSNFRRRNLSFKTDLFETHVALEYNLLPPDLFDWYPYIFAGLGLFHFNPYAYDPKGRKVYLKPLSTEGEGLPEYADRKPYSLNQLCIPFGGGIKRKINDRVDLAFELAFRKIFTDYLDDVSKTYVDYNILLQKKGTEAVEMAFRDLHGVMPEGHVRGSSKKDDWYFIAGLKFIYTLGGK